MAPKWRYVTITAAPWAPSDVLHLVAVKPDIQIGAEQAAQLVMNNADMFTVIDTLGDDGWELVTSFTAGSKVYLIFKHPE